MIINIYKTLFLFDIYSFSILRTDIYTCGIKNVLKLNLKNEKQIRTFSERLKVESVIFLRTLNLGSKNVVL